MKYLKKYNESRGETLIDKKIVYLNDITDDLRDSGYEVHIFNGSNIGHISRSLDYPRYLMHDISKTDMTGKPLYSKYIYLLIIDKENINDISNNLVDEYINKLTPISNNEQVSKVIKRLQSSKIGWRSMSVSISKSRWDNKIIENVAIIRIDKHSRINRQELEDLIG